MSILLVRNQRTRSAPVNQLQYGQSARAHGQLEPVTPDACGRLPAAVLCCSSDVTSIWISHSVSDGGVKERGIRICWSVRGEVGKG